MANNESITGSSDEWFYYLCSLCSKKGTNNEAVTLCKDCREYLCVACVESHNSFAVLARHTLVERSNSRFGLSGKELESINLPTEGCSYHSLKLIDMYCADHDSVGCRVCFTTNHKSCQGIFYIPEYVQTTEQSKTIKKLEDELEQTVSEVVHVIKRKEKNIEENKEMKLIYLKEIKAFRAEINEVLDRLEQASVAELDEMCGKLDQTLRDELSNAEATLGRLITCKVEMESSSQKNPSQQFVNMKIAENLISDTVKCRTRSNAELKDNLLFERNPEILQFLHHLDTLIKIPKKHGLYEVQSKKKYNVKLNTDCSDCKICSSCILDSGNILFADYNNCNIKLVDGETYKVINSIPMPATPKSICKVSSMEAAVSLSNKSVQFVSTRNPLMPTRSLKFDHGCRGIAVMDGQLVICEYGSTVYIHTMTGERLKTIEKDQSGSSILSYVREISVSDNSKHLHVIDRDLCLITIDGDGNVIWRYSGQELNNAWSVCTDENGNVFVSGGSSKNVVQLGSDGQLLGEVVSRAHGLKYARAVSFDSIKCRLIVSDDNELHVFHVK